MSVALTAVATFNLVCSGTMYVGDLKKEHQSTYSQTFRINLQSQRWCDGNCERTSRIVRMTDTEIFLKLDQDGPTNYEWVIVLNREDGSILDRTRSGGQLLYMNTGHCVRATFTGFPIRQF